MHHVYFNLLKGKKSVDCSEILRNDPSVKGRNGVYTIYPDRNNAKKVFCDMATNGGGWTVSVVFFILDSIGSNNVFVLHWRIRLNIKISI